MDSVELQEIEWLRREGRVWLTAAENGSRPAGRLEVWQRGALERQRFFARRAARRFPDPARWLWTDRALAQASDWWSARWKASLFPRGASVVDACCGAGVDLVALASEHPVTGVDLNRTMVALAEANVEGHGLIAEVRLGASESYPVSAEDWLHIDPDRRPRGQRTDVADLFSPAWEEVIALARRAQGAIVKVGPRIELGFAQLRYLQAESLRVWVGNRGECRQQLILLGAMREIGQELFGGTRQACVLAEADPRDRWQVAAAMTAEFADAVAEPTTKVARYVYDLHRCLHAAQLAGEWAAARGWAPITDATGYYTSDLRESNPWAQCFEVIDVLPWDDRKVRKSLRRREIGPVEVKTRMVSLDASRWQKRLSKPEGTPATLLVTRLGDRTRAILARRVEAAE